MNLPSHNIHAYLEKGKLYGLGFRFVEEEDVEFIVHLRTNQKLSQFLHPVEDNISKQIEWIKAYKQRESNGLDYYFIFEDDRKRKLGVSRIYNIYETNFTIGSWIFDVNAPFGTSILGDIIIKEIGFEGLGINKCLFDVRRENAHVLRYHRTYNPKQLSIDALNYYFELDKESFNKGKVKYLKFYNIESQKISLEMRVEK